MRIPKFILGALLSALIAVAAWSGRTLLEVKDRVTRIETTIQILLPASRMASNK
jgi:hypothetical protein